MKRSFKSIERLILDLAYPAVLCDNTFIKICWRGFFWQNNNWNRNRHQLPSVGSRLLPSGGAQTQVKATAPVKKTTSSQRVKKTQKKPQEAGYNVNIWKYQKPAKGKVHMVHIAALLAHNKIGHEKAMNSRTRIKNELDLKPS